MQDGDRAADDAFDAVNDLAIEDRDLGLLGGAALAGSPRKLHRVDVVQDFDVPAGHSLVPRRDAAARHGDDARWIDAERSLHPSEEWNPVQRLEADFRQPRPDNNRRLTVDDVVDLALDCPRRARPST